MVTTVHTDGACSIKDNCSGGWAWAVHESYYASDYVPNATNQQMELLAALRAVEALGGELEIISDSKYVVSCFEDGWWKTWLNNNWRNSRNKKVLNREYWEPLIKIYLARQHELTFSWVRGHSGDYMNDFVDQLAVRARIEKTPKSLYEWDVSETESLF